MLEEAAPHSQCKRVRDTPGGTHTGKTLCGVIQRVHSGASVLAHPSPKPTSSFGGIPTPLLQLGNCHCDSHCNPSVVLTAIPIAISTAMPIAFAIASAISSVIPIAIHTSIPTVILIAFHFATPRPIPSAIHFVIPSAIPVAIPFKIASAISTSIPTVIHFAIPSAIPTVIPFVIPTVSLSRTSGLALLDHRQARGLPQP